MLRIKESERKNRKQQQKILLMTYQVGALHVAIQTWTDTTTDG